MDKKKDKWFYYKIISAFLILGGILADYLYHMITQTWVRDVNYPFSYLIFQDQYFSFFTHQSNIIVGVWFLIAAIYHNKKNRLIDNQNFSLAITSYISVTCFAYVVILVPGFFIVNSTEIIKTEDLITGPFFHVLSPILMIIYSLTHVRHFSISAKKYYSKNFFFYLIYPWVYTLYIVVRIILYTNLPSLKDIPFVIAYPYLPFFESSGSFLDQIINGKIDSVVKIIVFFFLVHCLFIIFNLIYFFNFKKLAKIK